MSFSVNASHPVKVTPTKRHFDVVKTIRNFNLKATGTEGKRNHAPGPYTFTLSKTFRPSGSCSVELTER
jgi:hypothetical protein